MDLDRMIATQPEIDSIKLLVLQIEKKQDKNEYDNKMLETAKFKLKALQGNEIILK